MHFLFSFWCPLSVSQWNSLAHFLMSAASFPLCLTVSVFLSHSLSRIPYSRLFPETSFPSQTNVLFTLSFFHMEWFAIPSLLFNSSWPRPGCHAFAYLVTVTHLSIVSPAPAVWVHLSFGPCSHTLHCFQYACSCSHSSFHASPHGLLNPSLTYGFVCHLLLLFSLNSSFFCVYLYFCAYA